MGKAVVAMDLSRLIFVDKNTTIYTVSSMESKKWADEHQGTSIRFIKIPSYVNIGDKVVNGFEKHILKIHDQSEYVNMLHFVYFAHMAAYYIANKEYTQVLFENANLQSKVLMQFGNGMKYLDCADVI
ncbi:hypothetical protein [Companilactobacillus mishanensis]|uniref:Uncharacterized protein n=1 Tax=Companilactobacillus mishanensis TaxID=2486008 RepID=A0ABW9P9A0_9LACO|nr:hypothetical protein [Companilactobacillus mishanensis]MQS45793.1 hypothetical protein [Companilactobacillus mishanensis]